MVKEKRMDLFFKFYRENGRWPERNEIYEGVNIGNMYENTKKGRSKISEQCIPILEALNFFETKKKDTIHDNVLVLLEFFDKNDFWPFENEEYNGIKISRFAHRVLKGDIPLKDCDRERLQKLNFFEGKKKNAFHKKVKILLDFYNLYQRWPTENEIYKTMNLGNLFKYIRKNPDCIYEKDKIKLEELNFFKSKKYWKLHENVMIANKFYKENKRWITNRKDIYNETHFNKYFSYIISNKENLTSEDFSLLDSKGFFYDKLTKKVILVTDFFDEFNSWPSYHETFRNVYIGNYIIEIRRNYSSLSQYAKKLLDDRYFIPESTPEERQTHKVNLLLEFHTVYKRWPKRKEIFKHFNIGDFYYNINKGITKVSCNDKQKLIKAGFIFEK